eukprot:1151734-Pelagomonas_calceolata.AAC.5
MWFRQGHRVKQVEGKPLQRASPYMLSLMLMASNQGGQAGDSTCSLPGGGKQRGGVLSGVLCREQEMWQAAMQHQPSRDNQVLEDGSERVVLASACAAVG